MAGRCHHFVQNTWKKDLCSNCFKSKEEHEANGAVSSDGKSRYQSTLYSSRPYSWRRTEAVVQSILKDTQQLPKKAKGSTVRFPAEESEVIGYGGEENFSSDGEDSVELPDSSTASDEEEEGEEAKALQRLTLDNTDFNTFTANLMGEKQTRSSGRVMLGKPLTDSEGRRQTLQVTITPFGGGCDTSIAANRKSHFNKLLQDGTEDTVLLKSVTKLNDEIFSLEDVCKKSCVETNETKDTVNSAPLETNESEISEENPVCQTSNENNESSEHYSTELFNESKIQPEPVVKENKLHLSEHKQETLPSTTQEAKISGESDSSEGKASRIPLSKSRLPTEKSKPVIRTTAFNGKLDLHGKSEDVVPKPTIRKTVEIVKKTEPEKFTEPEVVKMKICPFTETIPVKDSEVSATPSFGDSGTKTDAAQKDIKKMQSFIFSNKSTLHSTQILSLKKTEIVDTMSQEHKTKVSGQDANNCATGNFAHVIAKPAIVESKETSVVCKLSSFTNVDSPLQSLQLNKLSKFSSDVPSPEKEVKETPTPSESCVPSETKTSSVCEDSSNKTSLLALQGINKLPPAMTRRCDNSMFNAEQHSRELAGEPDGRADPDEPTEPPALPRSPPPIVDPRPSFLHGASSIKQQSVEKPKIPTKPNKVLQAAGRQPAYLVNSASSLHDTVAGKYGIVMRCYKNHLAKSSRQPIITTATYAAMSAAAMMRRMPSCNQQNLSSSVCQTSQKEVCEPPLESPVTESRTPLKRQAPKPPPTPTEEQAPVFVVHKLPAGTGTKCQAPVAREKGKRERASSCSPKMREAVSHLHRDHSPPVSGLLSPYL
ncbi:hypothetical protein PR048_003619 [Dryococelus australis]|uniref:Uncharacterized protein n=1 Tax=Dryococelus australis TaxID=614101 RepID=A0ABQ9INL0_9NEOP|nr:hypothetical protein PR048_003619 [Dryococelus australis]